MPHPAALEVAVDVAAAPDWWKAADGRRRAGGYVPPIWWPPALLSELETRWVSDAPTAPRSPRADSL
jgi:hypothetical protein